MLYFNGVFVFYIVDFFSCYGTNLDKLNNKSKNTFLIQWFGSYVTSGFFQ